MFFGWGGRLSRAEKERAKIRLAVVALSSVLGVVALLIGATLFWDKIVLAQRPVLRVLQGAKGPDLIPVLAATGKVQLAFGALFALGLDITYAEGNQLQRLTDLNRVYDGTLSSNGLPHYGSARRFAAYNRIVTDVSDGEAEYKAATLTLQRRYANNYSLYGAVTWS